MILSVLLAPMVYVFIAIFLLDQLLSPVIGEMYKITQNYPHQIPKLKLLYYFVREKQFSYYPVYALPQQH